MGLIVKKGTISHLSEQTTSVARNGNHKALYTWAFRIENTPATIKSGGHTSLSDGDEITAVGKMKKGSLVIYAFRNDTTGAYDSGSVTLSLLLGIGFIIIGLPLSIFIVGIVPLFFGIRIVYSAYLAHAANALLKSS